MECSGDQDGILHKIAQERSKLPKRRDSWPILQSGEARSAPLRRHQHVQALGVSPPGTPNPQGFRQSTQAEAPEAQHVLDPAVRRLRGPLPLRIRRPARWRRQLLCHAARRRMLQRDRGPRPPCSPGPPPHTRQHPAFPAPASPAGPPFGFRVCLGCWPRASSAARCAASNRAVAARIATRRSSRHRNSAGNSSPCSRPRGSDDYDQLPIHIPIHFSPIHFSEIRIGTGQPGLRGNRPARHPGGCASGSVASTRYGPGNPCAFRTSDCGRTTGQGIGPRTTSFPWAKAWGCPGGC